MTTTQLRIATVFAGVLILLGLFLAQQRLTYGDASCGSAMNSNANMSSVLYSQSEIRGCNGVTDERKGVALGVTLVGAVGLAGALYGIKRKESAAA